MSLHPLTPFAMDNKILESISDVVVVVNQQGIIVDINSAVEDTFIWKREEILNQPLEVLLPDRFRGGHEALFKSYTENPISRRMGEGKGSKFQGKDKNGNEFYIDIGLSSFTAESGEVFYTAIVRDVSDIISVSTELERRLDELTWKNAELDQFAYIVSHDLKAPARIVKSLIDTIAHDYPEIAKGEAGELFRLIRQKTHRMSELIDGILRYSRAGEEGTALQPVNLIPFVKDLINNLEIPAQFTVDLNVPKIVVNIQSVQLSQVLSNLIENALKYHHKDRGTITLSCNYTIDELEFTIRDDGPGIKEQYHNTVFDMFGTAHEQSRSDSTGIGLAIVKKIVKRNGGTIQMNSKLGEGTTFTFTWKAMIADVSKSRIT